MKAWEDIEKDPNISIWWTENSEWYLDKGVKIEKFKDGLIEVKNVMGSGHRHRDVTDKQRFYFDNFGWLAGCYKVQSDECERMVWSINQQIASGLNENSERSARLRRDDYMAKKYKYDQALEKELKSLSSKALLKNENL